VACCGVPEGIQAFDEMVLRMARDTPSWAIPVFVTATIIGAGWGLLLFVPFLVHAKTRLDAIFVLVTAGTTNSLVNALKAAVGRVRPCHALDWCTPISISSPGGWSFPSGHAACSFAVAAFITLRAHTWTKRTLAVGAVMFVYAATVAWSRCVLGVHYPSDIAFGAVLGIAVGWGFRWALSYSERAWGSPDTRLGRWRRALARIGARRIES
jgi:undecaprenyl-diphosphatase